MKNENEKRGGRRPFSGAKPKYNEQTTTIAFRCPESKKNELKKTVNELLSEWKIKPGQ